MTDVQVKIHMELLKEELRKIFPENTPTRMALVGSFASSEKSVDANGRSDVDVCWTSIEDYPSEDFECSIPIWTERGAFLGERKLELFRPDEMEEDDVDTFDDALSYFPEAIEFNLR